MFRKLRNRFSAWRTRRRRALFAYQTGEGLRRVDPLVALDAIETHPAFNMERHPKLMDDGDSEAFKITAGMVRDVFSVDQYDPETGRGITLEEQIGIYTAFCWYLAGQKKSSENSPTQDSPTGLTSTGPSEEITLPTSA